MKTDQNIYEQLVFFDCIASIAYAFMQKNRGLLSEEEFALIKQAFQEIALLAKGPGFLENKKEICQAVDSYLSEKLPNIGGKFSAMRPISQRLRLDLYLLMHDFSLTAIHQLLEITKALYLLKTPDSLKVWDQSIADACLQDMTRLKEIYILINRFPIESHEINEFRMLGFGRVMHPPADNNYSSGKIQAFLLHHLVQMINSLSMLTSVLPLLALPELRSAPQQTINKAVDAIRIQADIVTDCLIQVVEISESTPFVYEKTVEPSLYGIDVTAKGLKTSLDLLKQLPRTRKAIPENIRKVLKTNLDWFRYHKKNWDAHCNRILQ